MKILFISRLFYPHIGGVEKHTIEIAKSLIAKGHDVTILTEKYDNFLKNKEIIDGIKLVRIFYPHLKYLGLIYIWLQILKHRKLINEANIVHIHDVFIWYLPFRLFLPNTKVFTTFHGWEGIWPVPLFNIIQKRIASKLSMGTMSVGKCTLKYYGVKVDKIIYGATNYSSNINYKSWKDKLKIVFVGRLSEDNGLWEFFSWLDNNRKYTVDFVGDGDLSSRCRQYGVVHGFTDPAPFMKIAKICVPGGYLTYIEAKNFGCKVMIFPSNRFKKDCWAEIKKVKRFPTWSELADEYLDLYNHI